MLQFGANELIFISVYIYVQLVKTDWIFLDKSTILPIAMALFFYLCLCVLQSLQQVVSYQKYRIDVYRF